MDGSNYANDNFDPWRSIGWQAALIVNRLHCQAQILELASEQKEGGEEKPQPENQAKEAPGGYSEDVENRLHDLTTMKQKGGNF